MGSSVTDDPVSRLYAGALLGSALSKELGEVGAQQDQDSISARRATLEAGVATGNLDPGKLSGEDLALLGAALTKNNVKAPSLVKDQLGFLGGFVNNLGK